MIKSSGTEDFSARLRVVRELRGLSQAELATRAKLQPAAISHFETGARRPSFDNLRRLAGALQVTTDYLLGRVDEVDANPTVDLAFRDYVKLSDRDRAVIQALIEQMSARSADHVTPDDGAEKKAGPSKKGGGNGGKES